MNSTEFANLTFFYSNPFPHSFVDRFLMIGSPFGKKLKVHARSEVSGFDGSS